MEKQTLILVVCAFLAGCSTPTVNLATSEPIKVNIDMRLDVYQHSKENTKKPSSPTTPTLDPEAARRNRMADIQQFKNSLLVGEGRDGLLVLIKKETEGEYGDYVRKTIASENADRMTLMKSTSDLDKIPLPDVQRKQADLWRNRAFKNEWIEVEKPEGTWVWVQKE